MKVKSSPAAPALTRAQSGRSAQTSSVSATGSPGKESNQSPPSSRWVNPDVAKIAEVRLARRTQNRRRDSTGVRERAGCRANAATAGLREQYWGEAPSSFSKIRFTDLWFRCGSKKKATSADVAFFFNLSSYSDYFPLKRRRRRTITPAPRANIRA